MATGIACIITGKLQKSANTSPRGAPIPALRGSAYRESRHDASK
jgi:hypothetical protein